MKKFLVYGLAAAVVVLLVGYITMQFFLGSIVKAGVNRFGPGITQTKVELQGANLSPLSGAGTEPKAKNGKPLKLEVKHFVLREGKVTLGVGTQMITMPMAPVELRDVGTSEGGVTPAGLTVAVMRSVTPSVIAASTQALTKV